MHGSSRWHALFDLFGFGKFTSSHASHVCSSSIQSNIAMAVAKKSTKKTSAKKAPAKKASAKKVTSR